MSKLWFFGVAGAAFSLGVAPSQASFLPSFRQAGYDRASGATVYTYDLQVGASTLERLGQGDRITLYDAFDPSLATFSGTMPSGIAASTALVTPPPFGTTPVDSPDLMDITFTYTNQLVLTYDAAFKVDFSLSGNWMSSSLRNGYFTSTTSRTNATISHVGLTFVPNVPEPAAFGLLAVAGLGLGQARRRGRTA